MITWLAGNVLVHRSTHLVVIVAVLSALAAAASGNRPTVITAMNLALVTALGAAVPAAASRCRPVLVAMCSLPLAACSLMASDTPILGPSAGVAGAAIAISIVAVSLRPPVLRAVAGALMVQSALRLPWPAPLGATALIAAISLTPVLIGGWPKARTSQRRVAASVGGLILLTMSIGVVTTAVLAVRVQRDARAAVNATQRAIDALTQGRREEAAAELTTAQGLLSSVNKVTHSWWASAGLTVPVLSQHLELARELTDSASVALASAKAANDQADPRELRLSGASVDLAKVASFQPLLERASGALQRLDNVLVEADSDVWIIGPLRKHLRELNTDVIRARRDTANALDIVRTAPALLGASGDRRYFIALMTPAELRGTIGIVGSYGEVSASSGTVNLVTIGRNSDLNETGVPASDRVLRAPDYYLDRYSSFDPAGAWQNTPMSPDWPTNAAVMADLYPQSGGSVVDGVIGMDPTALSALLEITGPISVPDWPEPITADNARRILLVDQYGEFGERTDRVSFLGEVAAELWSKLLETSPDPLKLADALGPAARGGHLMMWSKNPDEQEMFRRLGISGQIAPVVGDDVVAVTGINTGGDKMDAYLQRDIDYTVHWDPSTETLDATISVKLRNTAAASGLPPYVTGFADGNTGVPGQNKNWVTVYSPLDLDSATLDGGQVGPDIKTELGRHAISQYVRIDPGNSATFDVHLRGKVTGSQYRIAVTRQPMVLAETFAIAVDVPEGWQLSSPDDDVLISRNGSAATISLSSERDHLVVLDAQ